jgi:hypothetical protein
LNSFRRMPNTPTLSAASALNAAAGIMKGAHLLALCMLAPTAGAGSASAQSPACMVEPFQGATLPHGAVARMRVASNGRACAFSLYGVPGERANPAESGRVTKQALHGQAEFVAPRAAYTAKPGYVGDDAFELEAFASGRDHQQVHLKVRVSVQVVAP